MSSPGTGGSRRAALLRLLRPFAGLAVVVALFTALEPEVFLSAYNLKTVATQTVIVGLGALGMTFVIVAGGIDLAAGSVIALSSVVTAALLREGWAPLPAAAAGTAAGAVTGAISGLLVVGLRVVPFIATLGMMGVARGLAKLFADEQKIDAPPGWLGTAMSKAPEDTWLGLPPGVWLLFTLAALMALVLRHTPLGLHAAAIGSNERTARLCGVPVGARKVAVYAIGGAFAGLAGVMTFARLTVGDPTTAVGAELDIIAAVVIGGASLSGGSGSILGSLLGAFLMAFLANGCNLTGVPNYVQEILIGAIIVAAVAVDQLRARRA
jgi:ribose/xylose/arabinose/galactoside ABC-type transport system permease subunit